MDENLARLDRVYPNGKYVLIAPYNADFWKDKAYDSSLDDKSPKNKWRTNPLSIQQAQTALENGNRVGWVVPQEYVVVDIDNKDDDRAQYYIEKLLKKFEVKYSYNYTSRGIHILLRDPTGLLTSNAKMKNSLNVEIDTRANGTGYIILPSNDPHREWGEWNDFVEDIPYFLKPMLRAITPSFIGMVDGDGRNDALFKWRTQLEKCNKLSDSEVEKSIRIINENLFETAIPNSELFKTVLRDKGEKKNEKADKTETTNVYNKLAEHIVSKYDIISAGKDFYKYNGTYYKRVHDLEIEKLIHIEVNKNVGSTGRKEIMDFLALKTQVKPEELDNVWYKIACKNGIINLVTGELELPNKNDVNTIFIPFNYDKDPQYSPRIDEFMKELCGGDPLKMQFLYQVAGYCLLKKNLFEKFIICKGEGGTGKSTYTNLLHRMVGGDDNCSHIGLTDFDKDYYLSSTVGKLLNIDDDVVDGRVLEMTGRFKSLVSGNIISVRQIYREVRDFVPFVTCLFSCNKLPRIMDKTSGLYRRMILIELNHKVANPDPLFMNKVTDSDMEYMLFNAVKGIKLAIEEGRFRISQSEQKLLELFKRRQSSLNEWMYENEICLNDLHEKKCIALYSQFIEWCNVNGYTKNITCLTFKEDICTLYGMELDMFKNDAGATYQIFKRRGEFDPNWRPF